MYKYTAFISYSRAADSRLAPELKSALQNFAKPWYKLRAIQVFCDQTNLTANPDLWGAIENSLTQAGYFIYLASPKAAQSKWVRKEMEAFAVARPAHVIIVVTDGVLQWDDAANDFDWISTTAVPKFDKPVFQQEPTWIDLTWIRKEQLTVRDPRFLDAVANLSAILRGIDKDVLIGKDVEEHKKVKRFRLLSILGLSLLAIFLMVAAALAVLSEKRSQQRLVATYAANGNALLENGDFVMAIPWYVEAMTNDRDKKNTSLHESRLQHFFNVVPSLQQVWHTALPVVNTFFVDSTALAIVSGEPIDWGINEFTCFTNNNGVCPGLIQLVDMRTGKNLFTPIPTTDGIRTAGINKNGSLLATISVANILRVYDLKQGRMAWEQSLHIPASSAPDGGILEFNDSANVLLAFTQNKLMICNTTTGKVEGVFGGKEGEWVSKPTFLHNGNEVLLLSDHLRIWNYRKGTVRTLATPYLSDLADVVLSPDKKMVAIAGTVKAVFAPAGAGKSVIAAAGIDSINKPFFVDGFGSRGLKMLFSADGSVLAANSSLTTEGGSQDMGTRVWYARSGEPMIPWVKMPYEVNIRFSEKGDAFILTCDDGTTQVWQIPGPDDNDFAVSRNSLLHDGNTGQPSVISRQGYLVTVSDQHLVKLWKLPEPRDYYQVLPEYSNEEPSDTLSWYVATGTINDSIKLDSSIALLVDYKTSKPFGKPLKTNGQVYQAFVSPGGELIALQAKNGVSVWRKSNQKLLYTFAVSNSGGISSLAFSRDGKNILTGHFDFSARVWDAETGKPITPFMHHPFNASVNDNLITHFSNDETRVITKDYNSYRVWDAATGQPISTLIKSNYPYEAYLQDTTIKKVAMPTRIPQVRQLPKEKIGVYTSLLCACKVDDRGGIVSLSVEEYTRLWDEWKEDHQ